MCTCPPTSPPLPTYPSSLSARLTHVWLQGRIRLTLDGCEWVKLHFQGSIHGLNHNYIHFADARKSSDHQAIHAEGLSTRAGELQQDLLMQPDWNSN